MLYNVVYIAFPLLQLEKKDPIITKVSQIVGKYWSVKKYQSYIYIVMNKKRGKQ